MLGLIERSNHVRAIGIDAAHGHRVHQTRLAQLAREAERTTAQHIAGYERQRRHATLIAIILEVGAALTDQAIDLFERLVGTMFSKAETRHARAFQADGRAINEKVRLYARVGTALIAAREAGQNPFETITAVIPWERFRASVAEAEALARPEDFDSDERLGEHYGAMRRWAPAFLAAFSFQGGPAAASLLRAVGTVWRAWPRPALSPASASSPGSPIGIFATRPTPLPCGGSSIINSASRWRRSSGAALPHRRTAVLPGRRFRPRRRTHQCPLRR
jgi:hypothetical protein